MEEYTFVLNAIGTVGFPIIACIAMFYLYDNTIKTLSQTLSKMEKVLDKICEKLKLDED